MENIDPNKVIIIDESGANLNMTSEYARAEGGKRAKSPKPRKPGCQYSIIGAIRFASIAAVLYVKNAINTEVFKSFVEDLLVPQLSPGQYVVMDNINFHKNDTIISLIEETGATVVFLPPYSPDLSPIEFMWSKIKTILKKLKPRTASEFHDALCLALNEIDSEDLNAWYDWCGYAKAA